MELIEAIAGCIVMLAEIFVDYREDCRNRNARGLLKRPSQKYVV